MVVTTQTRHFSVYSSDCKGSNCIGTYREDYQVKGTEEQHNGEMTELYLMCMDSIVKPTRHYGKIFKADKNWEILGGDAAASEFYVYSVSNAQFPFK